MCLPLAQAKKPPISTCPDFPMEVPVIKKAAFLSLYIGIVGGILVALSNAFRSSFKKDALKSFLLAPTVGCLPGLGYIISFYLGWYTDIFPYFFPSYQYPSALVLGCLAGFLRGFYALRRGSNVRYSIRVGVSYFFLTFLVYLFALYVWEFMQLPFNKVAFYKFRYYHYAGFLGVFVGFLHGLYCWRNRVGLPRCIAEGIGVCIYVCLGIIWAFYGRFVGPPCEWSYELRTVPLCTLAIVFLLSQLYSCPDFFKK